MQVSERMHITHLVVATRQKDKKKIGLYSPASMSSFFLEH